MQWRMVLTALLLLTAPPLFECGFGTKHVELMPAGDTLVYRFGPPGRPELTITGSGAGGNLHYHRTSFRNGENQTLRFTSDGYDYVIYNAWQSRGLADDSGLLVRKGGRTLSRLKCKTGGEFLENPMFFALPQDEDDLPPDR